MDVLGPILELVSFARLDRVSYAIKSEISCINQVSREVSPCFALGCIVIAQVI